MGKKDPAANLFVIVLLASSMIYVLLRYYQRPLAFLVGIAPQILPDAGYGFRQCVSTGRVAPLIVDDIND